MRNAQRALLVVMLVLPAIILHTSLCEWRYSDQFIARSFNRESAPFFWYTHAPIEPSPIDADRSIPVERLSGLFPQSSSRELSLVLGVVVPLLLLGGALYVVLGWRWHWRLSRGRCPECGYDMRAQASAERCAECGWRGSQG